MSYFQCMYALNAAYSKFTKLHKTGFPAGLEGYRPPPRATCVIDYRSLLPVSTTSSKSKPTNANTEDFSAKLASEREKAERERPPKSAVEEMVVAGLALVYLLPPSMKKFSTAKGMGAVTSPVLIGSLLNLFSLGILLVQVHTYHLCFPKDSRIVKCLVYSILFAITFDTCLNVTDVQFSYAASFGNLEAFSDARFANFTGPIMGSVIGLTVHLFFCYRIFVIRRTAWPLCILLALVSMTQLVGGLGSGILAYVQQFHIHGFKAHDIIALEDRAHADLIYLWLIGGHAADVLITVVMTALLLQATMNDSTRLVAKDVVQVILETNIFSATVALVALILFVSFPDTGYAACPGMLLPGIYANTLLATLNNRAIILWNRPDESYSVEMEPEARPTGGPERRYSIASTTSVENMTFAEPNAEEEKRLVGTRPTM
ncbi:hypothetical protein K438DRAFT_1961553 [Mycena galopus ATCC 62051]|nr:hypothetical protein K438DRAFT_1961553 [Mycena galopus ATCC 62051]